MLMAGGRDLDAARREMEKDRDRTGAERFQKSSRRRGNPGVVDDPGVLPQAAECELFQARRGSSPGSSHEPLGAGSSKWVAVERA
jgi:pyrimidine-nucleoside phosphorylase